MSQPSPADVSHMLDIVQWLTGAVQTGAVTGLSIVLVDESDVSYVVGPSGEVRAAGVPVPRHVFFAVPGATALLAGGYVLAQHDLANALAQPVQARPPEIHPAQPALRHPCCFAPAAGPHTPGCPHADQPAVGPHVIDESATLDPDTVNELLKRGARGLDGVHHTATEPGPSAFVFEEVQANEEPPQKH